MDVDGDLGLPRAWRGDDGTHNDTSMMIAMSATSGASRGSGEALRRNELRVEDRIIVLAAPKIRGKGQEVRKVERKRGGRGSAAGAHRGGRN